MQVRTKTPVETKKPPARDLGRVEKDAGAVAGCIGPMRRSDEPAPSLATEKKKPVAHEEPIYPC